MARKRCWPRRPNSPSTCSSTTRPRTATSAARPGPSRRPATTTGSRARRCRTTARKGFDEGNVSDKPRFIREAEHLTPNEKRTYKVYYEKQLESLRAIDDGVKEIVDTLGQLHRLRNTYILFTSDNGFFFGEHRLIGGKFLAYEPATHLPFLIRGPGIKPDSSTGELAANIDIAPTILDLAGVEPDKSLDGRSMVPFLRDPELRSRRPILFESFVETSDVEAQRGDLRDRRMATGGCRAAMAAPTRSQRQARRKPSAAHASLLAPPQDYEGIRLGPYKYIAWPDGEKELYNINKDPNELNNIVKDAELLPDPELPPPAAAALRELRRARMPRSRRPRCR